MDNHELLLLRKSCGLSLGAQPPGLDGDCGRACELLLGGRYLEALQQVPALRSLLDATACSPHHTDAAPTTSSTTNSPVTSTSSSAVHDIASYYDLVEARASAALAAAGPGGACGRSGGDGAAAAGGGAAPGDVPSSSQAVLLAGVACLELFMQHNLTGPTHGTAPPSPLDLFAPPAVAQQAAARRRAAGGIPVLLSQQGKGGEEQQPQQQGEQEAHAAANGGAGEGESGAGAEASPFSSSDGPGGLGVDSQSVGDRWAAGQLAVDGEDLVGRCPAVQWLLLARRLLVAPLRLPPHTPGATTTEGAPASGAPQQQQGQDQGQGTASPASGPSPGWYWWSLRCVMAQQHALDGRSATLAGEAAALIARLLAWADACSSDNANDTTSSSSSNGASGGAGGQEGRRADAGLLGVLFVELALCQYAYGYVEAGRQYLARAGALLGVEPQLTGALGKRTVHQVDPKAQLVVVCSEAQRAVPPGTAPDAPVEQLGLEGAALFNRELEGFKDESEVFPAPQLVDGAGAPLEARYSGPEQALLLAWATAVKKGTSTDELQEWQMAPWVEAVLSQRRTHFMTAAAARLLKTRHERTRARTRERALLHMDQLSEALVGAPPPPPPVEGAGEGEAQGQAAAAGAEVISGGGAEAALAAQRAVLSWAVWFPLQVSLRREAAEHYVSMGLVGAAIKVFESLEQWDYLITCYRLLGKKSMADQLIRRRLSVTPDEPRLWCALGDLHLDDRYYEEAWLRSGQRHTRSQRSLARSAMRKKDYPRAADHWAAALALNPLHPEAWFSLGFCHLKAERFRDALRAFTRCTQQEPDNGEAWNNIAALWLHLGRFKPAFSALSEAVKHKRDSWQTWENYARAALASGHYQAALRGLQRALELSSGQRLYQDVVSGLLDVLEGRPPPPDGGMNPEAKAAADAEDAEAREGAGAGEGEKQQRQEEEEDDLKLDEAALGVPLLPLLADVPLPATHTEGEGADEQEGTSSGQVEQGQQGQGQGEAAGSEGGVLLPGREREFLLSGMGSLLRQAVNAPCCAPPLWGSLARYWALRGEPESAKEARLKQVRALSGGSYKSDEAKFVEYAEASEALCRAYVDCHTRLQREGKPGSTKDLAAGRMHLRSLLRTTAEAFAEHPWTSKLQALLEQVTQLEDDAIAAQRAAQG